MLPFLATYALFLIYPFFRGVWISLHDWNLLAVAFNPDAKEFVGLRNYERVMWGRNIDVGPVRQPRSCRSSALLALRFPSSFAGWTG